MLLHGVVLFIFFFFNDTATTEIYTLSLHDALPIWPRCRGDWDRRRAVDWRRARPSGAGAHHRPLPAHLPQSRSGPGQGERRAHLSDIGDDPRAANAHKTPKSPYPPPPPPSPTTTTTP